MEQYIKHLTVGVGDVSLNPHRVVLMNICFSLIWNNPNSKVLKQVAKPLVT